MAECSRGGAEKGGSRAALAAETGGIEAAAGEQGGTSRIRGGGSKWLHAVAAAVEARLPWRQPSILDPPIEAHTFQKCSTSSKEEADLIP